MSRRGGLSQQLKRKVPPIPRSPKPPTHAGIPRDHYIALQNLPSPSHLDPDRHSLQKRLNDAKKKQDRIQRSFDVTSEAIRKFQVNSKTYTDLLLVLDTLSECLTDVSKRVTDMEEVLASDAASAALAYRLQHDEVASHYEAFGRLDAQTLQPQPPSRRGLRVRSVNVPTPPRPQSDRQPRPQRRPTVASNLIQTTIPNYVAAAVTPGPLDTAVLNTPDVEPTYQRCKHNRLIRLNLSAGQNAKKLLRESCRRECGRTTDKLHTLWPAASKSSAAPSAPKSTGAKVQSGSSSEDDIFILHSSIIKKENQPHETMPAQVEVVTISSSESLSPIRPTTAGTTVPPTPPPSPIATPTPPSSPTPQVDGSYEAPKTPEDCIRVDGEFVVLPRGEYLPIITPPQIFGGPILDGFSGRPDECPFANPRHLRYGICWCTDEKFVDLTPSPVPVDPNATPSDQGSVVFRLFSSPASGGNVTQQQQQQ